MTKFPSRRMVVPRGHGGPGVLLTFKLRGIQQAMIYILRKKKSKIKKVVRADNTNEARRIASKYAGEEGLIWFDYKLTSCSRVSSEGKARVL